MMDASTATNQLEAALEEQSRAGDLYERAVGTPAELSGYTRLRGASRRVAECQRAVDRLDAMAHGMADGDAPVRSLQPTHQFAASVQGGAFAPSEARALLTDSLSGIVDGPAVETARLLVSELATNCVRHAGAGSTERIDVGVAMSPDAVRVEVSTPAPPFALDSAPTVRPNPSKPGGRGLYLVAALSRRWGVERHPPNKVWFELAAAAAN